MKIRLRLEKGWSAEKVDNKQKQNCDACGARLFVGPGNTVYCDAVHVPLS